VPSRWRASRQNRLVQAGQDIDEPHRAVGRCDPGDRRIERDDHRAPDRGGVARGHERPPEHLGDERESLGRIEIGAEARFRGSEATDRHDGPDAGQVDGA